MIHEGRNIKRIREILGKKQEALALELGINQQRLSEIERKEKVDAELMEQIAEILKVPVEAIRNFDEEAAVNFISNTINNSDHATGNSLYNYYPSFNPIDKLMDVMDENKKLYER